MTSDADDRTPVTLSEPRVQLPALAFITVPVIRDAVANLLRLDRDRWAALDRVGTAKRGLDWAGGADQTAMAKALVAREDTSKLPSQVTKAREELEAAQGLHRALNEAIRIAYSHLQGLVTEHAEEWAAQLSKTHSEALAAYECGARMMAAAVPVLTATGGLVGMLTNTPGALVVQPWKPTAALSIAEQTINEALPVARAAAPAPALALALAESAPALADVPDDVTV